MAQKKLWTYTAAAISIALLLVTFFPSFADENEGKKQSTAITEENIPVVPVDFRHVAKKSIPAVVSIKVKVTSRLNPWGEEGGSESSDTSSSPENLEEFWKNFFGLSKKRAAAPQPFSGLASGFIVSADGYVLTNSHVVQDASEVVVTLDDSREFNAKTIGFDRNIDVALLKIDATDLPYLALGDSDKLEVGEWVAAIGNPLGLQASLTVGVVSATGRNNLDLTRIEDFIQTDAAINRGNSGGPLLDLDGKVIGINTAIVTTMATGGYMGIGFAIPSNLAQHVMEELRTNGRVSRGFIGILLQPIDKNLAQSFNLTTTHGALVTEVTRDSPAEKAGIKSGDIITKLNGRVMINIAALRNAISLMKPASKVDLTLVREGKTMTVSVEVAEFPGTGKETIAQYEKLGFEVETGPALSNEGGVIVTKVAPGSVASWAGLKVGAVILEVNQKKIETVEQFQQEIASTPTNKPVLFLIKQGGLTRFISLKVE